MSTIKADAIKPITLTTLQKLKADGKKFACIALYDAAMATIAANSGAEILLVGDSLGMTVQGQDSTLPVTIEHMAYHTEAVSRGNTNAFLIADMPFMTYGTTEQALENAGALMQVGAHMVKLEGGAWLSDTVTQLNNCGIPVCAHLGLTPQSVNKLGGYRVQGRDEQQAQQLLDDAHALAAAGADLVVLECVPTELAKTISEQVDIMTIGIGAGSATHSQVLVVNDLLGMTPKPPKFAKNFLLSNNSIATAIEAYVQEVKNGSFPQPEHSFA